MSAAAGSAHSGRPGGRAGAEVASVGAVGGWHWAEWLCEFAGTTLLLLGGLSAVCLDFSTGSPVASVIPDHSARLLVTGLLFAGTGSLITISPIGRRSGAHLNPSVTLAFWRRGHVHEADLVGYVTAQVAGAFLGAALVKWWWGARARSVGLGATHPGHGLSPLGAAGVEALMTFVLVTAILLMVSSPKTAKWTPLLLWFLIAALVWQGAPFTGTSLNPARSLAPAVLAPSTGGLWAYLVGPLSGAALASALIGALPGVHTRTAKLFHDRRYPSVLASSLPVTLRRATAAASVDA